MMIRSDIREIQRKISMVIIGEHLVERVEIDHQWW